MPQLLHFLKVDQHTSFNVAGGALVSAAAAEAEAAATASDAAESAPPAPAASGGDLSKEKPFLNNSDKVRTSSLLHIDNLIDISFLSSVLHLAGHRLGLH